MDDLSGKFIKLHEKDKDSIFISVDELYEHFKEKLQKEIIRGQCPPVKPGPDANVR